MEEDGTIETRDGEVYISLGGEQYKVSKNLKIDLSQLKGEELEKTRRWLESIGILEEGK